MQYEDEQKDIRAKMAELDKSIESIQAKVETADMFISSARRYTRARKLTPRMLNELIERIEAHQAEKRANINANTRKGMCVSYLPQGRAAPRLYEKWPYSISQIL